MNKLLIFLLLLICNLHPVCSQNNDHQERNDNEAIQQIRNPKRTDLMSFQTQNYSGSNVAFIQQMGDQNKASMVQKAEGVARAPNQSFSIQQGNSNEITLEQVGSGNLLLGFQLGDRTSEQSLEQGNHFGVGLENGNGNAFAYGHDKKNHETIITGGQNKLTISQEGTNNNVMTVQQGKNNTISAEQNGKNNYLLILQKGKNNSVNGYVQSSENFLFDTIIQQGEGLSLNTSEVSKSKPNGNTFHQSGVNLSLQVNNQFVNALGGIEIIQSGRDMSVVVDQSHFSFPTR